MPYFKDTTNNWHFLDSSEQCYLLPAGCVEFSESEYQEYLLEMNTPTPEQIENSYINLIQTHMDSKAQEKKYDNIRSAALRAALPNSPFHDEGVAAGEWMDNCWLIGYQVLAEVKNGERELPTEQEMISLLPELVW